MNKFTFLFLPLFLFLASCAHKAPEYNYVSHDTLGKQFVAEKKVVCDHFAKSNDPFVLKKGHKSPFLINGEIVEKISQLEVSKYNLPAWQCGKESWGISRNISEVHPIGREVPIE